MAYDFEFAYQSINVTGSGTAQPNDFNGIISTVVTPPYAQTAQIVVFGPVANPGETRFKALTSEINHGLGPSATADDVIQWIWDNTTSSPPSLPPYITMLGDGIATNFTGTHNLGTTSVYPLLVDNITGQAIEILDITYPTANTYSINITPVAALNQYTLTLKR